MRFTITPVAKNMQSYAYFLTRRSSPKIKIPPNTNVLDGILAGEEGLEPPTCGFGDRNSTIEPFP